MARTGGGGDGGRNGRDLLRKKFGAGEKRAPKVVPAPHGRYGGRRWGCTNCALNARRSIRAGSLRPKWTDYLQKVQYKDLTGDVTEPINKAGEQNGRGVVWATGGTAGRIGPRSSSPTGPTGGIYGGRTRVSVLPGYRAGKGASASAFVSDGSMGRAPRGPVPRQRPARRKIYGRQREQAGGGLPPPSRTASVGGGTPAKSFQTGAGSPVALAANETRWRVGPGPDEEFSVKRAQAGRLRLEWARTWVGMVAGHEPPEGLVSQGGHGSSCATPKVLEQTTAPLFPPPTSGSAKATSKPTPPSGGTGRGLRSDASPTKGSRYVEVTGLKSARGGPDHWARRANSAPAGSQGRSRTLEPGW